MGFVSLMHLIRFCTPAVTASAAFENVIRLAMSLYTPTTVRLCGSHRAANRPRVLQFSRNGDLVINSELRGGGE
jgi:hypothetical protein